MAETASDELVVGAVEVLCEYKLYISQQNYSDLSLNTLDNALQRFYLQKGVFGEKNMSKSAKAKVDNLLERESQQLREQKVHKIRTAMEAVECGADKVSTTQGMQFQVCLNRACQVGTTWSDADSQKPKERLDCDIHQVTHAKRKLLDK